MTFNYANLAGVSERLVGVFYLLLAPYLWLASRRLYGHSRLRATATTVGAAVLDIVVELPGDCRRHRRGHQFGILAMTPAAARRCTGSPV